VTFTWTGSDDVTPTAQLVYSYKLDGSWSAWTSDTSRSYADLSNDDYTFMVKAKDKAGNEGTPVTRPFKVSVSYGGGGGGGAYHPPVTTNVPIDPTTGKVTTTTPLTTDKATLTITAGIIVNDEAGKPLSTSITMTSTPATAEKIGAIAAYDFGPSGTTFSTPIDLVITYDPADVPAGAELVIKMYDGTAKAWIDLETTVDTVAHTATAKVSHFTIFALFATKPEVTPTPIATPTIPTVTPTPTLTPTPTEKVPGFEAVFAIAGLLAVAYLVVRRKRK